jgi:hypothetical protein
MCRQGIPLCFLVHIAVLSSSAPLTCTAFSAGRCADFSSALIATCPPMHSCFFQPFIFSTSYPLMTADVNIRVRVRSCCSSGNIFALRGGNAEEDGTELGKHGRCDLLIIIDFARHSNVKQRLLSYERASEREREGGRERPRDRERRGEERRGEERRGEREREREREDRSGQKWERERREKGERDRREAARQPGRGQREKREILHAQLIVILSVHTFWNCF